MEILWHDFLEKTLTVREKRAILLCNTFFRGLNNRAAFIVFSRTLCSAMAVLSYAALNLSGNFRFELIFADSPASDITEILLGLILKKTASFEAVLSEYSVMPSIPRSCRVLWLFCCCFLFFKITSDQKSRLRRSRDRCYIFCLKPCSETSSLGSNSIDK